MAREWRKSFELNLPYHWQDWMVDRYGEDGPQWDDFPPRSVTVRFDDNLTNEFRYAIAVLDEARDELAVLTQMGGYHVFHPERCACSCPPDSIDDR